MAAEEDVKLTGTTKAMKIGLWCVIGFVVILGILASTMGSTSSVDQGSQNLAPQESPF